MKPRLNACCFGHLLIVLVTCSPALAQPTQPDPVEDGYPKNWSIDMLHYAFELQLSDDSDTIVGQATLTARYLEPGMSTLRLDLISTSELLEGKGMTVDLVQMDGRDLAFRHEDDQLFIDLDREVTEQERIQVIVEYHGIPASGLQIGPNKYGDRSFFSDNWSSRARNWLPTVDHPYDKATSELIVTAPDHYQVISNGLLVEETDLENGSRRTHWKNSIPIATWLYVLGAARFAVQYVDTFEEKSIQTWVYPQDRDAGFYDFAVPTKQVLAYYSDLIGPFSYEKLANVQSNSVGGGMEAASAIFYGDDSVTGRRSKGWQHVIIHEIAHQWFGNAVTEYEWNDLWLSEGFATYYTLRFREHAYGHDDFIAGLKEARDRVFAYFEDDYDFQIIRDNLPDLNDVSGSMIYQKGAWVLHMLRMLVGEQVFDEGVRTYYAEYKDRNASTGDFRRHIEEASGMELSWFFGQWLYQGGIPRIDGHWTYNETSGELILSVRQVQPKYTYSLSPKFEIVYEDDSTERVRVQIDAGATGESRLKVAKHVVGVVPDPDLDLLARWVFEQQ